jgi:hypothetical protein
VLLAGPRRLREGQRDHGDLFQAAVSGARDLSGGRLCPRARSSKSKAFSHSGG